MESFPTQCVSCVRKRGALTCDAFPSGIPDSILVFGADHRKPVEGDHGLQFKLKDIQQAREDFADWDTYHLDEGNTT